MPQLKKTLLSLTLGCLLFTALPAKGAIQNFVQIRGVSNSSTLAYSSNVTAGHILFAFCGGFNTSCQQSVADSQSNHWAKIGTSVFGTDNLGLYATVASSTGADTVTYPGMNTVNAGFVIAEYAPTTNVVIQAGPAAQAASSSVASNSGANLLNVVSQDVGIVSMAFQTANSSSFSNSGLTVRINQVVTAGATIAVGDADLPSSSASPASPLSTTWTFGSSVTMESQSFFLTQSGGGSSTTVLVAPSAF